MSCASCGDKRTVPMSCVMVTKEPSLCHVVTKEPSLCHVVTKEPSLCHAKEPSLCHVLSVKEESNMKKTIAVIFGGCSTEYGISLKSAYSVISHIDRIKYEPVLFGITSSGEWFYFTGEPEKIRDDIWHNPADCVRAIISPCRRTHGVWIFDDNKPKAMRIDAAMPILHGKNGEDGTIQGLLELAGIPIIGCGAMSSALCMDKDRAHKIAEAAGVNAARSFTIRNANSKADILEQAEKLGYPLFVKPVKNGSSYGITKVMNKCDLYAAVKLAFEYDDEVIVEENIDGFEVGCAILGNDHLIVGDVDEISLTDGFLDYQEKYTPMTSKTLCPAGITVKQAGEIKETAKTIYRALGCAGFARVDMFLTPSGKIFFSEVNTIPGFTSHSRYPNMLKSIGMTFGQIVNSAIGLAVCE